MPYGLASNIYGAILTIDPKGVLVKSFKLEKILQNPKSPILYF
jgi:hypothetical protein